MRALLLTLLVVACAGCHWSEYIGPKCPAPQHLTNGGGSVVATAGCADTIYVNPTYAPLR